MPLTILTGFLGAGKSTLTSRLFQHFTSRHLRVAIINNEAADAVEPSLVTSASQLSFGTLLTLANGCVCCSLTSDLVSAINHLLTLQQFHLLVLECSGLASPAPLVGQLWVDEEMEDRCYLDGVIALVDAVHWEGNMARSERAQMIEQIAYSDRVVLNKADLVADSARLQAVKAQVQAVNPNAPVLVARHAEVPLEDILFIRAYDQRGVHQALDKAGQGGEEEGGGVGHEHDESIGSVVLEGRGRARLGRLKEWLSELLWSDAYSEEPAGSSEGEGGGGGGGGGGDGGVPHEGCDGDGGWERVVSAERAAAVRHVPCAGRGAEEGGGGQGRCARPSTRRGAPASRL